MCKNINIGEILRLKRSLAHDYAADPVEEGCGTHALEIDIYNQEKELENLLQQPKTVLWFSRHDMTQEQESDLERIFGNITISQVNQTIQSTREIETEIEKADILAIVAPIQLQKQFLSYNKPVIACKNKRIIKDDKKIEFEFEKWYEIQKIDVVTRDL